MNASNLIVLILSAIFMWSCAYGGDKRWNEEGELTQARRTIALFSGDVQVHGGTDEEGDIILNKPANLGPVLRDLSEVIKQGGLAYSGQSGAAGNAGSSFITAPGPVPPHEHAEMEELLRLVREINERDQQP